MESGPKSIENLTPEQKLDLLEEIWERLSAVPAALPLTDAQRKELDRRLDQLEQYGPVGESWGKVRDRIRALSD